MVNTERLAERSGRWPRPAAVSRREGMLAGDLRCRLEALGAEVGIDDTAAKTGSDTGNLIAATERCLSGPGAAVELPTWTRFSRARGFRSGSTTGCSPATAGPYWGPTTRAPSR